MSNGDDIRNFSTRRRNLLFLMQRYLFDNGYYSAAESLKTEARLNEEYELCDNVDLDAMYLEYANYYNLKFGKYPKFLKKSKPTLKLELTAGATHTTTTTMTTTSTTTKNAANNIGGIGCGAAAAAGFASSGVNLGGTIAAAAAVAAGETQNKRKISKPQAAAAAAAANSVGGIGCNLGISITGNCQAQLQQPLPNITAIAAGDANQQQHHHYQQSHQLAPNHGRLQVSVKKLDLEHGGGGGSDKHQQQQQQTSRLMPEIEHAHISPTDEALFNTADWQQLVELVKTTIMHDMPNLQNTRSSSNSNKLAWNDICGNQQAIELLKEAVLTPIKFPQLFVHGLKPWRSLLLHGPPGSGKTLLARTLYAESQADGVTFFNISSSILISKWRGESEKLLRVLFHMAVKRAPAVIFFDEIEGLTSRRDRATDHESSKRFKNELLQLLDGMEHQLTGVFILASTNLPWEIDEAFLRRFEKKLLVQLPNGQERAKLISKLLALSGISLMTAQLEQLVQLSSNFTGDEIRLACKEIAMQNVRRVTRATCHKTLATTTIGGGGNATVTGLTATTASGNSQTLALERAFQQIKPLSVKLMARHEQWQQEHGS